MLVFLAVAGLNMTSQAFQIVPGVSFVFPAAAVASLGGVLFGWWGVLAVFAGFFASPWGLVTSLQRLLLFSAIGSLQAIIPVLARLREEGPTAVRTRRFFLWAVLLNTLASAIPGVTLASLLAREHLAGHRLVLSFLGWALGDAVAVVLLAVPVVLFLRPGLLLAGVELGFFRRWLGRWRLHLALGGTIVVVGLVMETLVPSGFVNIHWLAIFLLGPVLVAAAAGGPGAGMVVTSVVGVLYVSQVLRLVEASSSPVLLGEIMSAYLNVAAFTVAAVVVGGYAARTRALVVELDDSRLQLQKSFENVVVALAAAIEAKDSTTEGHVQRVAGMVVGVGRRMGITGRRLEILRYAAILHDVGKIGVPENILNKPGELDTAERELMERHVTVGVEILESVDLLRPAIPIIRYHQERWDGRTDHPSYPGYFGLAGEEIPLEARIIAVVDAFDAMVHDRPYRRAMPLAEAREELLRESGRQFDPAVVEVLLGMIDEPEQPEVSGRWPLLGERPPAWPFST